MTDHKTFSEAIWYAGVCLRDRSSIVHTEKWQGVDISKKPEMATHEVRHHFMRVPMNSGLIYDYQKEIGPSIPWADDHFAERVCGQPINPGIQWQHWPWGHSAKKFLDKHGKFNHNYMERYWCKSAGYLNEPTESAKEHMSKLIDLQCTESFKSHAGIYHEYGDLRDVVNQLTREPMTRQAIFPVWFPEDTGVVHGGRVPCSLFYQFFMRDNKLDVTYMLRSCDYMRHFRDDIYLTVRLLLWVLDELRQIDDKWKNVNPGTYVMLITSLHCFRNDYVQLFGDKP